MPSYIYHYFYPLIIELQQVIKRMENLHTLILDLFIITILSLSIIFASNIHRAHSISPSFPRQEVVNVISNEVKIKEGENNQRNITNNNHPDPLDSSIN